MSTVEDGSDEPRAVVHKRILEVASSRPEASLTAIAKEVSGATPDLVERVLSEYGDPGETGAGDGTIDDEASADDRETTMSQNGTSAHESSQGEPDGEPGDDRIEHPSELPDKQLETVRAVYEHPDATQADLTDRLDVSRATVSRRLSDIPGFEWTDREEFTSNLFDSADYESAASDAAGDEPMAGEQDAGSDTAATGEALRQIEDRLDAVENRLDEPAESEPAGTESEPPLRPELAQKVVHAAMNSERITEEEELELLSALLDW